MSLTASRHRSPGFGVLLLCIFALQSVGQNPGRAGKQAEGQSTLPPEFVYLRDLAPGIIVDLRYFGTNNFVGERIDGYEADKCILTKEAAAALVKVQSDLRRFGFGLKIFDAYRPQRAVDHFLRWSKDPSDNAKKSAFYPDVEKKDLIPKGYIAAKSGHSRGSAVDVTIVELAKKGSLSRELDMGSPFDLFGPVSHSENPHLKPQQRLNRLLLRTVMEKHGFQHLPEEWWHFWLRNEPFPKTYFNFPVR